MKYSGCSVDPRVIGRYMVRHEIQEQPHASLREFSTRDGETFGTSEVLVHHVAPHAIRGSDIVFRPEIGKSPAEIRQPDSGSDWQSQCPQDFAPRPP